MLSSTRPGLPTRSPAHRLHDPAAAASTTRMTLTVCSLDDPKDDLGSADRPGRPSARTATAPRASRRGPQPGRLQARPRARSTGATRATAQSVTQTSSIINPVGGLGPSVTGLTMTFAAVERNDQVRIESSSTLDQLGQLRRDDLELRRRAQLVGERRHAGEGERRPDNWTFTWDLDQVRTAPTRLLRLHVRHPGGRLRRPGPRGCAARR